MVRALCLLLLVASAAAAQEPGRSLIVCGEPVDVGVPVVTWKDPGGWDGHLETCFFDRTRVLPKTPAEGCDEPLRYGPRRNLADDIAAEVSASGWSRTLLERQVEQVVVHYDECGTSRRCFEVLHDLRGLSCHLLLDLDGTLYQTLDLAERARHAGGANDRSIGIEIAHEGPLELHPELAARYRRVREGGVERTVLDLGERAGDLRANAGGKGGFVVRPARTEPVTGRIQQRTYTQYDFTDEQYRTLTRLLRALSELFPRVALEAPRDAQGAIKLEALSREELAAFRGVLGHFHVTTAKQDPGPAFDWARALGGAR
jgi:N-acetylmuramoyl-L-alanine amidase